MADPTAHVNRPYELDGKEFRINLVITNSEALKRGGYVSLDAATGTAEFSADDASHASAGIVECSIDGIDDNLAGDGSTKRATCVSGITLKEVSVTGVTALTDVGSEVYASDGSTLTLSAGSNNHPFGMIVKWYSSTTCDVYSYPLPETKARVAITAEIAAATA